MAEYRQVFKNSNLIVDAGFTEGYKKTSSTKTKGNKSHFFLNLFKISQVKIILKIPLKRKYKTYQIISI